MKPKEKRFFCCYYVAVLELDARYTHTCAELHCRPFLLPTISAGTLCILMKQFQMPLTLALMGHGFPLFIVCRASQYGPYVCMKCIFFLLCPSLPLYLSHTHSLCACLSACQSFFLSLLPPIIPQLHLTICL